MRSKQAGRLEVVMAMDSNAAAVKALFGKAPVELRAVVEGLGLAKYRAVQLGDALYKQRVERLEEVTTLPAEVAGAAGGGGV